MADLIDRSFQSLAADMLPKRRGRKRKPIEPVQAPPEPSWDDRPLRRTIKVNGLPVTKEFFEIGALAMALGKRPNTIRAWIDKGWLPKAMYATSRRKGTRGDAGRRLWTRLQVENIRRIAQQEGLMDAKHHDVRRTNFTRRVVAGFRDWK
jgi:hypothetical protein